MQAVKAGRISPDKAIELAKKLEKDLASKAAREEQARRAEIERMTPKARAQVLRLEKEKKAEAVRKENERRAAMATSPFA